MQAIHGFLIVFAGAGIGGVLRHAVNRAAVTFGWTFPWHTLLVNVSGCLLMGIVRRLVRFPWRERTGLSALPNDSEFFGGFTTFSAFSLDAALLWERGQVLSAALYIRRFSYDSVACVFLGLALMRTQ